MLLLLNSYYGAMKKTLKLNRFLAKVELQDIWNLYHRHIHASTVVLELCNNKNLRYWFKATLTLETRIGYICNTHSYQKVICDGPEMKLT